MNRFLATAALVALCVAPALADPTSDVKGALIGLAGASSYHVTITAASGPTVAADFVKPGKVHVTAGPMELIMIDKATYVKMSSTWHQFSFPGIEHVLGPLTHAQDLVQSHDDIVVTDLGSKTVDGGVLHAYGVKPGNSTKSVTMYLDGSGALVRIDAAGPNGTNVVRFSNVNGPITIEAPVS